MLKVCGMERERAGLVDPRCAARRAGENQCTKAQAQRFLTCLLAPFVTGDRTRFRSVVDLTVGLVIVGGGRCRLGGVLVEGPDIERNVSNSFHLVILVIAGLASQLRCVLVRSRTPSCCRLQMPTALRSRSFCKR